jgi:hypothetical protein
MPTQMSDENAPNPCGLKSLPLEEKRLIFWCVKTNSTLLKLLADITGKSPESIADRVGQMNAASNANREPSESEMEKAIDSLISKNK